MKDALKKVIIGCLVAGMIFGAGALGACGGSDDKKNPGNEKPVDPDDPGKDPDEPGKDPDDDEDKILTLGTASQVEVTLQPFTNMMGTELLTWRDEVAYKFTTTDAGNYRFYVKSEIADESIITVVPTAGSVYPDGGASGKDEAKGDWYDYGLQADTEYAVTLEADIWSDYATFEKAAGDKLNYEILVEVAPETVVERLSLGVASTVEVTLESVTNNMSAALITWQDKATYKFTTTDAGNYRFFVKSEIADVSIINVVPTTGNFIAGEDAEKGDWYGYRLEANTEYTVTLEADSWFDYATLGKAAGEKLNYSILVEAAPENLVESLSLGVASTVEVTLKMGTNKNGATVLNWRNSIGYSFTTAEAGTYRFYVKRDVDDSSALSIAPASISTYPEIGEKGEDAEKGDWYEYKLEAETEYRIGLGSDINKDYAEFGKNAGDKIRYSIMVEFVPAAS